MNRLLQEKLDQAGRLVAASEFDCWLIFVRETAESGDPILPYLIEGSLTWQSALIIGSNGKRVVIVGTYDAPPLQSSGLWDEVVCYDQDIRSPLISQLENACTSPNPKIGVNFSVDDEKCDGLTHGMFLLLQRMIAGTRFSDSLVSAEQVCKALRSQKTATELSRIETAIEAGDTIFHEIGRFAKAGRSELEVFEYVHSLIRDKGWGFAWDRVQNPIVNSGPDSAIGHSVPSSSIRIAPNHILHIDLGVTVDGYSGDIQRCWYVGSKVPDPVQRAFETLRKAICAGFNHLKPGVRGFEVDQLARSIIVEAGYPEYMHALGHQVGRVAHDGGALLGPRWVRYGDRPTQPICEGEVYTLELGVKVSGHGYLGLEEMVLITSSGARWLSAPQTEMWIIQV